MVTSQEQHQRLTELMRAALAGDQTAYRMFLTDLSRILRGFLLRRIPASDVEDVLQEILLSVHRARHTYDGKRPVLPWVLAIARFRMTDYLRQSYGRLQQAHIPLEEVENTLAADTVSAMETPDVTRSHALPESVAETLAALAPRQQTILQLLHGEGYSAQEVGARLNMSLSAVKVAAHRAYQQIRGQH